MDIFYLILFFAIAYLLGSFPTAYLVAKKFTGKDIREGGTRNIGALNVFRLTRKLHLFLLTLIGDVGKGALSVLIPQWLSFLGYNQLQAITVAGFGVVLGHCFSLYFKIKEGKFGGGVTKPYRTSCYFPHRKTLLSDSSKTPKV